MSAAARRWPQPLVLHNGKLILTQPFVDFHRKHVSEERLVLVVRVEEAELFFAKRENVERKMKLKPYDHTTHMVCLMEHEGKVQIYVVAFSPLPKPHKLCLDYCSQLSECELPCEEREHEDVPLVWGLETFYDILDEMRTVGLSEKEMMDMLHPHIIDGGITWTSQTLFSVRSLEDVLLVRKEAQRMIDRVKFCSGWTSQLLRTLNIKPFY